MHDDNIIVRYADHNNIQSDPDDPPYEPQFPGGDFDDIDYIGDDEDDDDDFENTYTAYTVYTVQTALHCTAEVGRLSPTAKTDIQIFVKHIFAIFRTNVSLFRFGDFPIWR